jgi:type II secretory pathway predicted ATPase ExeA
MSNKLEILSLFGFRRDPFAGHEAVSADGTRIKNLLSMAISAHAQISIVGERGIGKTRAVNACLKELKIKAVRILTPDKTRVTANDIQEAMLVELAPGERIRQDREIRVRQLRRILGAASREEEVVVIIDEAHRLHGNTLRSLKNLRELDWMGQTHLFTVVLIGQSDSTQKIGLSEVRLRTETVIMHGLTEREIIEYVRATVGSVFSDEAISVVACVKESRNYLDLQEKLIGCMANALGRGAEKVEIKDVSPAARPESIPETGRGPTQNALKSVLGRRQGKQGLRAVEETA